MPLVWLAICLVFLAPLSMRYERLPLELASLLLVIAAVLAGWLSPAEALAGFGNPATITVVAMFVISEAVLRTGALTPLERWLERFEGTSLPVQLLLLGMVVGPLSAVLSNTAVVAMFIPLVERWCRRLRIAPARMLMPLSFLTVLAGMGTLLGTSTSLVASGLSQQLGYGSFRLLQFTPMALITFTAGGLVLILMAPLVLPDPGPRPTQAELTIDYGVAGHLCELLVTPESGLIGRSVEDSRLQHDFDVRVLTLLREGERHPLPLGDRPLRQGDVLQVKTGGESLQALRERNGLSQRDGSADLSLVRVIVPAGSPLIGRSLRDLRFAQRFDAAVLAIRRNGAVLSQRLGRETLRLGDALLMQAPHSALRALQVSRDLLVSDAAEDGSDGAMPENGRWRLAWALGLTLSVLLLSLWRSDALAIWSLLAVVGLVGARVLTAQEAYGAVRWDVVVLLAALLPLARVLSNTGADRWLVEHLLAGLGPCPPYALLLVLYLCTALVTEFLSNQAAVTLMLPLGLALSAQLDLSAAAVMAVVTFAASHSFLTPIGYQTNTMVYAIGNYSFADFFRLGLPITLVLSLLTPALALILTP